MPEPEQWYCWRTMMEVMVFDVAAWGDGRAVRITRSEVQAYTALVDQLREATGRIKAQVRATPPEEVR